MSNWLPAIIGGVIGVFANKAIRVAKRKAAKQLHDAYKDGYTFGFKAGLRRGKALQRVDVAPGVDSIRPSAAGVADKQEGVAHD